MREDEWTDALRCPHCDAPYDDGDNFCRRCGAGLNGSRLPAVRDSYEVVSWQPSMPALVRGAAVVAAGTLAEALLRRLATRAFRSRSRHPVRQAARLASSAVGSQEDALPADTQLVSETWVLRRVRLRR